MIDSFNDFVPGTIPKMTDSINPIFEEVSSVPYKGLTSLRFEEDPMDKEGRAMDRRLREHQGIKWSKEYYKEG